MRHDHNRPFDIEADEAADTTTQFWGTTRSWAPQALGDRPGDSGWQARTTGSLQAIRDGLVGGRRRKPEGRSGPVTGRIDRTRSHGIVRPNTEPGESDEADTEQLARIRREATLGELAAGWIDENEWPQGWSAPTQRVAAVQRRESPSATASAPQAGRPRRRLDHINHVELELEDDISEHESARRAPIAALSERLGIGAADPLLARLGAIVLIGAMLVPVAMSARSGSPALTTDVAALAPGFAAAAADSSASLTAATTPVGDQSASQTSAPVASSATVAASTGAAAATEPSTTVAPTTATAEQPSSTAQATALVEPATAQAPAERVEPVCALTYPAVAGDSWYRIADGAGITPRQLLDANLAMLDTPIFPGDEICLPAGSVMPAPPTTAPPSTAAPSTAPPSTTPATTRTPSTTTSPTTAAPVTSPPAPTASQAQVQQLIRDIWPDDLEQRALEIAYRESRYIATAYNGWCCYGVFQIYYTAHDGWLDEIGVDTASDLYDAQKNITAAYLIYQRSGGWGPWGG
jgi:hypothetical protein